MYHAMVPLCVLMQTCACTRQWRTRSWQWSSGWPPNAHALCNSSSSDRSCRQQVPARCRGLGWQAAPMLVPAPQGAWCSRWTQRQESWPGTRRCWCGWPSQQSMRRRGRPRSLRRLRLRSWHHQRRRRQGRRPLAPGRGGVCAWSLDGRSSLPAYLLRCRVAHVPPSVTPQWLRATQCCWWCAGGC